jgi:hypothetical protein
VFVPGKTLQPSLMFALRSQPTRVKHLTLPTHARLDKKGLAWTNTLAYYEHYGHKKFYKIGPKLFDLN